MDRFKLEYYIKSRGHTFEDLCDECKFSESAFYRKLKGSSEFTQGEIQKIVDALHLTGEEVLETFYPKIFYSKSVLKDTERK